MNIFVIVTARMAPREPGSIFWDNIIVPLGVVLADSQHEAYLQAKQRWPEVSHFATCGWKHCSRENRLDALEADRQMNCPVAVHI
jgi:hypothetical protein